MVTTPESWVYQGTSATVVICSNLSVWCVSCVIRIKLKSAKGDWEQSIRTPGPVQLVVLNGKSLNRSQWERELWQAKFQLIFAFRMQRILDSYGWLLCSLSLLQSLARCLKTVFSSSHFRWMPRYSWMHSNTNFFLPYPTTDTQLNAFNLCSWER